MSGDFLKNSKEDVEIPELVDKCPYCDQPLNEDKTFCHKCGKYLGEKKGYSQISEEKAKRIRIIVGTIAVVIFVLIYFFLK